MWGDLRGQGGIQNLTAGIDNDASHATDTTQDGNCHAKHDAHPGCPEVPVANLRLFEHQINDGR